MEIKIKDYKQCTLIKLSGRVDANTSPILTKALEKITDDSKYKIVIDMSDVEFISSSGTWALMEAQKVCKRWNRGAMIIAAPSKHVMRTFELSAVPQFIAVMDEVIDAVGSF